MSQETQPDAAEPLLEVLDLSVEFPTRHGSLIAVDGVSFDVAPGEVLGVVGESGAGKSMTGMAVLGLLEPPGRISAGEIRLAGQRIDNLGEHDLQTVRGREIGAIFQDPLTSLNPLFSVGDQLIETIRAHLKLSRAAARARAIALLKEVGIPSAEGRLDHYPHQFSGGQRQRISIASALVSEPEFLVCDEPTSALDVSVQAQILNLMRKLQDGLGLTYLFISHDLSVVRHMSDAIAVTYLGRIVEEAPTERLFARPLHPYTRLLLETIPDLEAPKRDRSPMAGEVPSPLDPPEGCAFHPRCPLANERCRRERPALRAQSDGDRDRVACHAVEERRLPQLPDRNFQA